jgi:hypothetical protein
MIVACHKRSDAAGAQLTHALLARGDEQRPDAPASVRRVDREPYMLPRQPSQPAISTPIT